MREIKFRAWDGEHMYWPHSLHFNSNSTVAYCINPHMEEVRNPILMQYTGLKDKNGVEIYENDIVKAGKLKCEVFYNERFASFDLATTGNSVGFYGGTDLEVIGNIHQHPELLK